MARWQRDPKARRRLAILLGAVEVVVLFANSLSIIQALLRQVYARVAPGWVGSTGAMVVLAAAGVVVLGVAIFEAVAYVKGRRWAAWAFIAENAALVLLGIVWFVSNRFLRATTVPNIDAAIGGLVVPLLTLFPLLWPLLVFRPTPPDASEAAES